jgi:hypothetical protein
MGISRGQTTEELGLSMEIKSADSRKPIQLDASKWTFVLLEYPDGTHEVLLKSTSAVSLTNEERWHAAALVLESTMGEELFLDRIDEFELVDELEPRFAAKERPIALLRQVLVGATRSCDEG